MILYILSFLVNIILIYPVVRFVYKVYPFDLYYPLEILSYLGLEPSLNLGLLVVAILLLLLCSLVSLLPSFQAILMWLNGGRAPKGDDKIKLEQIINILESYSKKDLSSIKFYVDAHIPINAYALGRNRIAIGRSLLHDFHPYETAAILAHELGHITLKHSSFGLAVYAMNTLSYKLFYMYYLILHLTCVVLSIIPFMGWGFILMQYVLRFFVYLVEKLIQLPYLLVYLFIGRRNEFAADAYAGKIGLGKELASALYKIEACNGFQSMEQNFFQSVSQTHPASTKRIERLMKM